jgi:hypothetical protein
MRYEFMSKPSNISFDFRIQQFIYNAEIQYVPILIWIHATEKPLILYIY